MIDLFAFLFGIAVGSFANVCIYRLPLDRSVVHPRSHCTRCGSLIRFYDNLPLVSYLWLRGRCRQCGASFSVRYLLVELLVGITAVVVYRKTGLTFSGIYWFLLATALMIVSFIDLDHRIIPDEISIGGTISGVVLAGIATWLGGDWPVTLKESLIGAAVGSGMLWGVGFVYEKITGREGMGFGDVKLLALFGAHAGVKGVFTSIFVGSFLGSFVGLFMILVRKKGSKYPIPFGPFLCLGLLFYAIYQDRWMAWLF